jgi:hypothetical protein
MEIKATVIMMVIAVFILSSFIKMMLWFRNRRTSRGDGDLELCLRRLPSARSFFSPSRILYLRGAL